MIKRMLVRAAMVGATRYGVKLLTQRQVAGATDRVANRLGEPVANALPEPVLRAAGSAVVAAEGARRAAQISKVTGGGVVKAGRVVGDGASRVRQTKDRLLSVGDNMAADLAQGREEQEREMRADWLRYSGRPDAATDALLDRRSDAEETPLPEMPEPIPSGRLRYLPGLPEPLVGRVRRTYQRPRKPWDR